MVSEEALDAASLYTVLSAQLLILAAIAHLNPPPLVLALAAPALLASAAPTVALARLCSGTRAFKVVTAVVLGRLLDAATAYTALALGLPELNPLWRALPPLAMLSLQLAAGAVLGALAAVALLWEPSAPRPLVLALRLSGAAAVAASWYPVPWNTAAIILALAAR
jgi:hypothetical protein